METNKRNEFLKVIQGGLPSEKDMKNKLPSRIKDLKRRFESVKHIQIQVVEVAQDMLKYFESYLGEDYLKVHFMPDMNLKELYKSVNDLEEFIKHAEKILENERQEGTENSGKEPGE